MIWTPTSIVMALDSHDSRNRLARALLPWAKEFADRELLPHCSRYARHPVDLRDDVVQDVMIKLFKEQGRVLKSWQPMRGLSLRGFVRWVVRYQVRQQLRTERRNTRRGDPTSPEVLDQLQHEASELLYCLSVWQVRSRLLERETARSRRLYRGLFVEQHSADELARELGMTRGAVDQWKARFKRRAAKLLGELDVQRDA